MKLSILLVAVTALAASEAYVVGQEPVSVSDQSQVSAGAESVAARSVRANFGIGGISVGDYLLYRARVFRNPITNVVQSEDVTYRGAATGRIYGIYAFEQGVSQGASAWLVSGGLGQSVATLRMQSLPSRGYDYIVEFYGQY